MARLHFQPPLLRCSVSHDTLEVILIWFGVQETFHIIIKVEKSAS